MIDSQYSIFIDSDFRASGLLNKCWECWSQFFYLLSLFLIILIPIRYTSLGSQDNTLPNPLLETRDRIGQVVYLPAYTLKEEDMERKGRISSKHWKSLLYDDTSLLYFHKILKPCHWMLLEIMLNYNISTISNFGKLE